MKIEKVHNKIRYTLSNENLRIGDKVFPIARGRCLDDGTWILHNFDFRDFMCGFPNEPHIIMDLKHSTYKPYELRTNMGYSPLECYYKIIKIEEKIKIKEQIFGDSYEWIKVDSLKQKI